MVTILDQRVSAEPQAEVVGGIGVGRAFSSNITYEPAEQIAWVASISAEVAVETFTTTFTIPVERPPSASHQADLIQSGIVRINAAKVRRNALAGGLLAKLYENRVLTFSELGTDCTWLEGAALAQLAGALLCDVDQTSVRITDYGVSLVQGLVGLANS